MTGFPLSEARRPRANKRSISKKYRQGWKRVHFPRPTKRVWTVRADMDRDMEVHSGANGPKAEAARPFGRRPLQRRGMVCTL